MLVIRSSAAMADAIASSIYPALKRLLIRRHDQLIADGFDELGDIASLIAALPGDHLVAVEAALGVPIATNIVDGSRYPDPAYQPNWEWCIQHESSVWEMPFILSDAGDGTVLLVMDQPGVDPTLLALCRQFGTISDQHLDADGHGQPDR